MRPRFSLATLFVVLAIRSVALAASHADLEQEYSQVRKIALKDPRVQDGFEKANERLNEKILQIDPALKPIVDRQARTGVPAPEPTPRPQMATVRPQTATHAAVAPVVPGHEHTVLKGETLTSIAARYKVKVASLEKANHITDDRKLQVGQKLVIPAGGTAEAQPAASTAAKPAGSPATQNGAGESLWDRLKSGL